MVKNENLTMASVGLVLSMLFVIGIPMHTKNPFVEFPFTMSLFIWYGLFSCYFAFSDSLAKKTRVVLGIFLGALFISVLCIGYYSWNRPISYSGTYEGANASETNPIKALEATVKKTADAIQYLNGVVTTKH